MVAVKPCHAHTLQELVGKTAAVYSLPLIYERLTAVINHPRSSIADITRVISEDQGLSARLLKLANSPLFGYFSRIDSISMAATIIGTQQLQALALAVSVKEAFSGIPEEPIGMKSFWRHSIACASMARALATYRREINVERVFAAGLLHDVGRLVMCSTIPGIILEMIDASRVHDSLLFDSEFSRLGFTHADLGSALLTKWNIPLNIIEPVACHHTPRSAGKFFVEAALIHLADIICKALEMGSSGERFVPPLERTAWDSLGIPAAALAVIVRQVRPQLAETLTILGESTP
ncbi:MAG TPA: HDOD domain-containing protein [Geobacteraceae bacterium]|nr:HDOD domain-containing protein [Geobacteraceae bacterium]